MVSAERSGLAVAGDWGMMSDPVSGTTGKVGNGLGEEQAGEVESSVAGAESGSDALSLAGRKLWVDTQREAGEKVLWSRGDVIAFSHPKQANLV